MSANELHVFLEDSRRTKELEQRISELEQLLVEADAKVQKFHDALVMETQRNIALEDKVRAYGRIYTNR